MDNFEKRDRYAYLSKKLDSALDNEFYYEAILIEYAIMDDRTKSIMRHANYSFKDKRDDTLYNRLNVINSNPLFDNDKCNKAFDMEFIDRVNNWRDQRNGIIHALVEHNYDETSVKNFAIEGDAIVKHLCSKSKTINKWFDEGKC